MAASYYDLKIKKKIIETDQSTTIVFDQGEYHNAYKFKAGQYVNIDMDTDESNLRRAYSLSSSPIEEELAITVKAVIDGQMSPKLVHQTQVGDILKVGTPEGKFTMNWNPDSRRQYFFFAAGSGITPIISLIKTALEKEPKSTVHLMYGNRKEADIILKQALDVLHEKYAGQLFIHYCLSSLDTSNGLFKLFKKQNYDNVPFIPGRLSIKTADWLFDYYEKKGLESHFFICGPGEMIVDLKAWAEKKVSNNKQIHVEYFSVPDSDPSASESQPQVNSAVTVIMPTGEQHVLNIEAGSTLLDGLLDQGIDAPHSCTNGVCSSCVAKLSKGKVHMENQLALDDDELKEGLILTCQARATSEVIEIEYN